MSAVEAADRKLPRGRYEEGKNRVGQSVRDLVVDFDRSQFRCDRPVRGCEQGQPVQSERKLAERGQCGSTL